MKDKQIQRNPLSVNRYKTMTFRQRGCTKECIHAPVDLITTTQST